MLFLAIYLILSMYFASLLKYLGIMIRLLLVLAPGLAISSGIGLSSVMSNLVKTLKNK
jgi:asparagine N-glycosylation enzyme membrane subunit Stt3